VNPRACTLARCLLDGWGMRTPWVVLLVTCAAGATARAACPPPPETVTCDGGAVGELRTYLRIADPVDDDTRASITDCGEEVRLRGWWFKPAGPLMPANGYPTIIYSHGSEDMKTASKKGSAKCTIVDPLVAAGYAVFVAHRRGHGKSTGIYYEDWQTVSTILDCADDPQNCPVIRREAAMSYLHRQANDVEDAYNKVKGYPEVNPKKMFLMGHSFGGMVTMFANEKDLGHKAAVNFAGGGESWDGDPCLGDSAKNYSMCSGYDRGVLQDYLITSVDLAKAPVYSFDTKHDVSIAPVYELPYHAWKSYRGRFQATLFGPVSGLSCKFPNSDGNTVSCDTDEPVTKPCPADPATGEVEMCGNVAHAAFATQSEQIARWMPSVLEYLHRFGGP